MSVCHQLSRQLESLLPIRLNKIFFIVIRNCWLTPWQFLVNPEQWDCASINLTTSIMVPQNLIDWLQLMKSLTDFSKLPSYTALPPLQRSISVQKVRLVVYFHICKCKSDWITSISMLIWKADKSIGANLESNLYESMYYNNDSLFALTKTVVNWRYPNGKEIGRFTDTPPL